MTKFEEALEHLENYELALDLVERAAHGWTNKSFDEVKLIHDTSKNNLHNFLKENLND